MKHLTAKIKVKGVIKGNKSSFHIVKDVVVNLKAWFCKNFENFIEDFCASYSKVFSVNFCDELVSNKFI